MEVRKHSLVLVKSFRQASINSTPTNKVYYAVPVFYNALPQYLKNELVRIEKRALSIILPHTGYTSACGLLGITPITKHHSLLCSKLFDEMCSDTGHKLDSLLPPRNEPKYNLRNHRAFPIPHLKTNRTKKIIYFRSRLHYYIMQNYSCK